MYKKLSSAFVQASLETSVISRYDCAATVIRTNLVRQFSCKTSQNKSQTNRPEVRRNKMLTVDREEKPIMSLNQDYSNYVKSNGHLELRKTVKTPDLNYEATIRDLNLLQSNTQSIALAKYKNPRDILPLFAKQLAIVGIKISDLDKLNIIHVSGTKGKGSTCAYVESILRHSGLKTGFYNSPHLIDVTERIRLNGEPISNQKFCYYFRQVFDRLKTGVVDENITMPSYFSFLTILAFHVFIEEKVDCAVIEVGIGGEYDPTNIIRKPVVCGITAIHFDHMNILGDTIESIAWSKAGIAKSERPVITIQQEQRKALQVIESRAKEKQSPLFVCETTPPTSIRLGISSSVQYVNAGLACQLASCFLQKQSYPNLTLEPFCPSNTLLQTNLDDIPDNYKKALQSCSWPGRCQIISYLRSTFFLDGAHTKESMANCIDWFLSESNKLDPGAFKVLMINIIGERNKLEILRPLAAQQSKFKLVIFSTNRIMPASGDETTSGNFTKFQTDKSVENAQSNACIWNDLLRTEHQLEVSSYSLVPYITDGIDLVSSQLKQIPDKKFHILATGSLHFVGAVLETLPLVENLLNK